jgi:hypothetical protein
MEPLVERLDEVKDRIASVSRSLQSASEASYTVSAKDMRCFRFRLNILTYGYMVLQVELVNAQNAETLKRKEP